MLKREMENLRKKGPPPPNLIGPLANHIPIYEPVKMYVAVHEIRELKRHIFHRI
jgi:hypothetical protein